MFSGRSGKINLAILIVLLVLVTVYYFISEPAVTFSLADDYQSFTLSNSEGNSTFYFSDLTSLQLSDSPDYGESEDGETSNDNQIGIWQSDTYGTYFSYISTKISNCIIVTDSEKTAVFNYENDESTDSLYQNLIQLWE